MKFFRSAKRLIPTEGNLSLQHTLIPFEGRWPLQHTPGEALQRTAIFFYRRANLYFFTYRMKSHLSITSTLEGEGRVKDNFNSPTKSN